VRALSFDLRSAAVKYVHALVQNAVTMQHNTTVYVKHAQTSC
jgi:hypothetical protein